MPISPHDVSVVVQGPVAGKPDDPPALRLTAACLDSVRRHLPGAEVILSPWAGSDRTGLDCDVYVESPDPGAVSYWQAWPIPYNVNRQLVSTAAGLEYADRRFTLKIRSDIVVTGTGFLDLWTRFPTRADDWRVFRRRVVASAWPTVNPRRVSLPFALSDWFTFGLREDVAALWGRPPADDREVARYFDGRPRPTPDKQPNLLTRYNAEQYIWLGLLREHGEVPCDHIWDCGPHNFRLAELTLANNAVVAEPARLGIEFRKYDFRRLGVLHYYTHAEWLGLYRHYCDPRYRLAMGDRLRLWRDRLTLLPRLAASRLRGRWRGLFGKG